MTGSIEKLEQECNVKVVWHGYPLTTHVPAQGLSLAKYMEKKGKNIDTKKISDRLVSTARDMGLPFTDRLMVYNTRKAQELGLWAQSSGKGHIFHNAAYRATFVDSLNLYDTSVLINLVKEIGLDPDEAERILETGAFAKDLEADWNRAKELEIVVVPTFIMGEKRLAGVQTYGALKKLVADHSR